MGLSLLLSKTTVPRVGSKSVVRQRLYNLLDEGMRRKLTVVCAASGYGKTTLVASWLHERKANTVWISLDANDHDFATVFSYLASALEAFAPALRGRYRGLRYPGRAKPSVHALMQDLLDVLREFDGELVLVLDDYHHIRSDSIHTALKFLVDYLPPNVHLFVLTRVELPFKISDWRVKDVCYEIATADMRCSDEEAREFMKLNAPFTVGAKEAEQLNRVTEGWITGLKLATLSIERTRSSARLLDRASGLSHLFSAYLMEEVLAHQAEETKEFLLKTSILSQLSPPLCDRVGPFENSQRILRTLEKENAFISPLDATHRWYRYHQIFQEFLYQRLESNCGDVIEGLHRRAGEWFREEGMLELAIEHYLRGNMCGLAVSLIDEVSGAKWARGEVETLHAWLKALPVEEIEPYPDLLVLYADLLFSLGLGKNWPAC